MFVCKFAIVIIVSLYRIVADAYPRYDTNDTWNNLAKYFDLSFGFQTYSQRASLAIKWEHKKKHS